MPAFPPDLDREERRRILELYHYEGMSYREIAREVGRSKGYVGRAVRHEWVRNGEELREPPYEWPAWEEGRLPGMEHDEGREPVDGPSDDQGRGTRLDMGDPPSREAPGRAGLEGDEAADDDPDTNGDDAGDEESGGRTIIIGGS